MDDDTRLRGGHGPGEGVQGLVAALADGGREAACANTYAALDLGTNNCRLLIACPTGDSFRVVDSFSRIIRLGEGVSTSGVISDAAIARSMASAASGYPRCRTIMAPDQI